MKLIKSERADAEVIGHAILLGITILGVGMITLYGVPTINSLQDMVNIRNAEQAFTVLDSRASRASLGEALRQVIDINLGGGSLSVLPNSSEPSYILVELKNGTSVIYSIPVPMGKIAYRLGDREVAYEGGGVWSKYPSGSVMISSPEFHYNGITLTLPVVNISGTSSTGGRGTASLNMEKKGAPQIIYPTVTFQNPIPENATYINITIKSEYYDAWADYFKSIPLTSVYSDSSGKKVTVTLETPPVITNFSHAALASDEIVLENSAEIDSYNSSMGNYSVSRSGNGSIRANNEIELKNTASVNGTAFSGGIIDGSGCGNNGVNCVITKDAYGSSITGVSVLGTKYGRAEKLSLGSTTATVQEKIDGYKALNNNISLTCLNPPGSSTIDLDSGTCIIVSGNYYLIYFRLKNTGEIVFDTSLGDVNIAVDGSVDTPIEFINQANITIIGNNNVKIYVKGGLKVDNSAKINRNTNDNSSRFQIIGSGDKSMEFKNTIEFCGFIYSPDAEFLIENSATLFGAFVGKSFKVKNSQNIHFDEALKNLNADLGEGTNIMYFHVTSNGLGVSIS